MTDKKTNLSLIQNSCSYVNVTLASRGLIVNILGIFCVQLLLYLSLLFVISKSLIDISILLTQAMRCTLLKWQLKETAFVAHCFSNNNLLLLGLTRTRKYLGRFPALQISLETSKAILLLRHHECSVLITNCNRQVKM